MTRDYRSEFIKKAKSFRKKHNLREKDIDLLFAKKGLKYTGLESNPKKVLSIEMAELYPLLFGMDYCTFKNNTTTPPDFSKLPEETKAYIELRTLDEKRVGAKGSKNIASHVILVIKDYPVGFQFLNFQILKELPGSISNETTIDWSNGLLKGLVINTKKYKKYKDEQGDEKRGMIYTIAKPVTAELLEKATNNIEKERLEDT